MVPPNFLDSFSNLLKYIDEDNPLDEDQVNSIFNRIGLDEKIKLVSAIIKLAQQPNGNLEVLLNERVIGQNSVLRPLTTYYFDEYARERPIVSREHGVNLPKTESRNPKFRRCSLNRCRLILCKLDPAFYPIKKSEQYPTSIPKRMSHDTFVFDTGTDLSFVSRSLAERAGFVGPSERQKDFEYVIRRPSGPVPAWPAVAIVCFDYAKLGRRFLKFRVAVPTDENCRKPIFAISFSDMINNFFVESIAHKGRGFRYWLYKTSFDTSKKIEAKIVSS